MSRFDGNPFDEESANNPHAEAKSGGVFSKFSGKPAFSASAADASAGVPSQKVLASTVDSTVQPKNFPPCFPLIHHDIKNDIPADRRHIQSAAFWSWMGIMICLTVNLVGAIASWAAGTFDFISGIGNFFLALIYLLLGIPLSFFLWYKPLYTAMKTSYAGVSYTMFFISYTVHIAFCIFATIAPPFLWRGYSFTGFWSGITILTNGWIPIGIIYLVGAALFCMESFLSVYVIGRVFARFRGKPI